MATRLPLRAVDPAVLRKLHSEGKVYLANTLERSTSRALDAEKPIEEMSLAELIATQDREPLTESRRSFLIRGEGVSSLDAPANPTSVVTLLETVADDGPRCIHAIVEPDAEDDEANTCEHDARRYGTPYETVDPITRRQILWEQERAQDGPLYTLHVGAREDGRLTVENIGRGIIPAPNPDTATTKAVNDYWAATHEQRSAATWLRIARSALRSVFDSVGRVETLDDLHARVDLAREIVNDPVIGMYRDPDATEERERVMSDADRNARYGIEHSSYEMLDDDGTVLVMHRSPRRSPWERWHNELPRNSSDPFELGMDLCSNTELESLLGVTEWDENGNALDSERSQLMRSIA